MIGVRTVLFIQGGGAGTHDEWDDKLVASLRDGLGTAYEIRYPRMPDEGDPSAAVWGPAIRRDVERLDDGGFVVGHSVGGTLLVQTLAELPAPIRLGGIVLVSAPFVGEGGWPPGELELPADLGDRLPAGVPVHLFHGLADEEVPVAHADAWARAVPQAQVHRLPGRDHQLGNDLVEVAAAIRSI
jgi:pimeloyl-ACP methyl ester carboxylesterase